MAKTKGKNKKKKKSSFEFDAAGWPFWTVLFVLLVGPGIYGSLQLVRSGANPMLPVGMGVVSAAIGAGVVSWAVNSVIQWRRKKKRLAERKKARKRR